MLPADEVTKADIPLGLMLTSLSSRYAGCPIDGTSKMIEKKSDVEASLSTAEIIKLRTRPSPPPRPMTCRALEQQPTNESQHRLTQLTQHETHGNKQKYAFIYAKGLSAPSHKYAAGNTTPNPTQNR
jgi:hypothetical protein